VKSSGFGFQRFFCGRQSRATRRFLFLGTKRRRAEWLPGNNTASCRIAFLVVFYNYEFSKFSDLLLLTPECSGSGEPAQPGSAIRGRVDFHLHWQGAPGFFLPEISRLLGDVQGPLENRADAL